MPTTLENKINNTYQQIEQTYNPDKSILFNEKHNQEYNKSFNNYEKLLGQYLDKNNLKVDTNTNLQLRNKVNQPRMGQIMTKKEIKTANKDIKDAKKENSKIKHKYAVKNNKIKKYNKVNHADEKEIKMTKKDAKKVNSNKNKIKDLKNNLKSLKKKYKKDYIKPKKTVKERAIFQDLTEFEDAKKHTVYAYIANWGTGTQQLHFIEKPYSKNVKVPLHTDNNNNKDDTKSDNSSDKVKDSKQLSLFKQNNKDNHANKDTNTTTDDDDYIIKTKRLDKKLPQQIKHAINFYNYSQNLRFMTM